MVLFHYSFGFPYPTPTTSERPRISMGSHCRYCGFQLLQCFRLTSIPYYEILTKKFSLCVIHFKEMFVCPPSGLPPSICIMAGKQYCHLVGVQNVTFSAPPPDLSTCLSLIFQQMNSAGHSVLTTTCILGVISCACG